MKDKRHTLTVETQHDLQKTQVKAEEALLKLKNVNGVGVGLKQVDGGVTGTPAITVMVEQKVDTEKLASSQIVPPEVNGIKTDVIQVGHLMTGQQMALESGTMALAERVRPAQGGYSVAHYNVTAGTIATCVYDILPNGSTNPPVHGYGVPTRYYLLSNNHVLANTNSANIGDPILQPGPVDGGTDPADRIGTLAHYIPIMLTPQVPLTEQNNLVDAAIAQAPHQQIDRAIYWLGHVRGWRLKQDVIVGTPIKKTGRTTHTSYGVITTVNATVDVNFGSGRIGRFREQMITTNISAGGDSGSLIMTTDNVAVGLLFAGSQSVTIANQIENVRALLEVEVADQVL